MKPLSKRHVEILRLLGSGMDHPTVAKELWLGLNTVYSHTKRIRRYFGVRSTRDAVEAARSAGVI